MTLMDALTLTAAIGIPLLGFAAIHGDFGARLRHVEREVEHLRTKVDRIDRLTVRIADRMGIQDPGDVDGSEDEA